MVTVWTLCVNERGRGKREMKERKKKKKERQKERKKKKKRKKKEKDEGGTVGEERNKNTPQKWFSLC